MRVRQKVLLNEGDEGEVAHVENKFMAYLKFNH